MAKGSELVFRTLGSRILGLKVQSFQSLGAGTPWDCFPGIGIERYNGGQVHSALDQQRP